MLSQVIEGLLDLYVSMSKVTGPKAVQKYTEEIYWTRGEDDQEVCSLYQHLESVYLEMLKSVCLQFLPFL